jgi:hypothetical protein
MKVRTVTEPERKILDAEVVRDAEPRDVERVKVSRVPASGFFRAAVPDTEPTRKRLQGVKFRLWLWLAGFLLLSAGCFYAAAESYVVIWSAFLLIAGCVCALAVAVLGAVIWTLRRLSAS